MTEIRASALFLAVALTWAGGRFATTAPLGTAFTYQGRLEVGGQAADGAFDLTFTLWDSAGTGDPPAGGNQIGGPACADNVSIASGLFTVALNTGGEFGPAAFNGEARWLQVGVRPDGVLGNCAVGVYSTLAPRQPLSAVPQSLRSLQADGLSLPFAATADVHNGAVFKVSNSDTDPLFISTGIWAESAQFGGRGVYGFAPAGVGGSFETNSGTAVQGRALTPDGFAGAFTGRGHFTENLGVGTTQAATRLHIEGGSDSGLTGGGFLTVGSLTGANISVDNNEIMGRNNGAASPLYLNHNGGDVLISASGTGNVGIGTSSPQSRLDIRNTWAIPAINAEGNSSDVATAYFQNLDGIAGSFSGNVHITGTLLKSGGSFRIDHPLDPANKYLQHSFVESPDMMNIYNGNVVTDQDGFATVTMPEWFEALNRDFRYQLTVIGEFAQAIVAEELQEGRFVIRTDKPGMKVSWQITGIRQDAWAEAHRIPVETVKPTHERGRYQHPELYGQPRDMGVNGLLRSAPAPTMQFDHVDRTGKSK